MADADPSGGLEGRTTDRVRQRRSWAVGVGAAAAVVIVGLAWLARPDSSSDSAADADEEATGSTPTDVAEPAATTGSTSSTSSTTTSTTEARPSSTVEPTSTAPPTSTVASTTTVAPTTTVAVSAPPATVVISYSPFDGDGALVEPVLGSEPGRCVGAAFSAHRADAYRCFAGDQIHDPCFAPPVAAPTQVARLASIPGTGVLVLELTEPLPPVVVPADDPLVPFVFVVDDGIPCTPFTGTSLIIEGIRMDYGCGSAQTGLGYIGGALDTSSPTWTFLTTDADRTAPLTSTPIVTAYV